MHEAPIKEHVRMRTCQTRCACQSRSVRTMSEAFQKPRALCSEPRIGHMQAGVGLTCSRVVMFWPACAMLRAVPYEICQSASDNDRACESAGMSVTMCACQGRFIKKCQRLFRVTRYINLRRALAKWHTKKAWADAGLATRCRYDLSCARYALGPVRHILTCACYDMSHAEGRASRQICNHIQSRILSS